MDKIVCCYVDFGPHIIICIVPSYWVHRPRLLGFFFSDCCNIFLCNGCCYLFSGTFHDRYIIKKHEKRKQVRTQYDDIGNRTQMVKNSVSTGYTYNNNNQSVAQGKKVKVRLF